MLNVTMMTSLPSDIDDICNVLEVVDDFGKWRRLGLQLGLRYTTLEEIRNDHRDKTDECRMEMLAAWLRQQDNVSQTGVPSWSVLRAALRRIGENELASRIMVSCEYNTVTGCARNKLSIFQEDREDGKKEEEEEKGRLKIKRRKEEEEEEERWRREEERRKRGAAEEEGKEERGRRAKKRRKQ